MQSHFNYLLFVSCFVMFQHRRASSKSHYITTYLQDSCKCKAIDELRCDAFVLDPTRDEESLYPSSSSFSSSSSSSSRHSGFVQLSRDPRDFSREFYCTFVIRAPPGMRVAVEITGLDLPPAPAHLSAVGDSINYNPHRYVGARDKRIDGARPVVAGSAPKSVSGCLSSILQIYDAQDSRDFREQLIGICGTDLPSQNWFTSTDNHLTLYYQHAPEVASAKKFFNITYTFFTKRRGGCSDEEFRCGDEISCISFDLVCDGVNNCHDGLDETQDFDLCARQMSVSDPIVGGVVASAIFVVLVFLLLFSFACNKRKRRLRSDGACASAETDKMENFEASKDDDDDNGDGHNIRQVGRKSSEFTPGEKKVSRSPSTVTYANVSSVVGRDLQSTVVHLQSTLPRSSRPSLQKTSRPMSPNVLPQRKASTPRLERRNAGSSANVAEASSFGSSILGSAVRPLIFDAQTPNSNLITPTEMQPTGATVIVYSNNIPLFSPRLTRHAEAKLLSPCQPPSYSSLFPESRK